MSEQEQSKVEVDVVSEIESYGQHQSILTVNRDGDKFYIECPECHSTDLNSKRIISCRSCHTHFSVYLEDGFRSISVLTSFGTIGSYKEAIKLMELKPGDYFKVNLLGRNESRLNKIKEKYPDMKVIKLYRDLQKNGKDAHDHAKYKRYAIIPLD